MIKGAAVSRSRCQNENRNLHSSLLCEDSVHQEYMGLCDVALIYLKGCYFPQLLHNFLRQSNIGIFKVIHNMYAVNFSLLPLLVQYQVCAILKQQKSSQFPFLFPVFRWENL